MIRKLSVVVLAAAMLLCTAQASQAVLTPPEGPTSPATGYFPVWYQDGNALSLELCLSAAVSPDPAAAGGLMCVLLPSPPFFDETLPVVFPVNFPDESFWFAADGAVAGSGVDLRYVAAIEAAFAGGGVVNGDQVSFARIRIFADVPTPGTYTITHPYGVDVFNVAVVGAGREIQFTRDIGLGAPGNFAGALGGDIGPFLRASATPGGTPNPLIQVGDEFFIGDPNIFDNVTGSPFGTDNVRVQGPGGIDVSTNLFALAGKVFGGILPANVTVDRATYSRSAAGAGTVDVFSTTDNTSYLLTFRDTIATTGTITPMAQDAPATGKFYGRSAPTAVPPYVIVTAVDPALGGATPTSLASNVVDVVKITRAQYDPVQKNLTIEASSSDAVATPALPTLTAVGYGPLAVLAGTNQQLVVPLVDVPPARVTVKSSGGGADTEPVTVIPATSPVPVAVDDFLTTLVNTAITDNVLTNDTGGTPPVTVANLTQPANGQAVRNADGTVTYTPNNCFTGTDTFTYTALDSLGAVSNVSTVTVTVEAVSSTTPVAVNDGPVGMTQGTPFVDINVVANDTQGAETRPLKVFSATQPPAGTGTVAINSPTAGSIRYSPPPSVFGTITFTYRATNDVCAVSANSATVTVRVNGKPVANNVGATTPTNTFKVIALSATDPDGNTPLTYTVTSAPSAGSVANNGDGTVTYDATDVPNGTSVTFNYTATDTLGAVSNTATVTVLINAPLVAGNDTATTTARTPVTITVLANDTGGTPPRSVVNLTQPTNGGTVVLNATGTVTYTPGGPGTGVCPSGTGAFTYQARDSVGGTSNTANVTVTVTPRAETQTATGSARRTTGNTRADWTLSGTTSVPFLPNGTTPNQVTVRLRTATGAFIGTANPDKAGRWKISLKGSTVVPNAPTDTIHVTSSYCNAITATVTVR
jgi:hypothetical protein